MSILILNCGSSSLKFALFSTKAGGEIHSIASGSVEGIGNPLGRFKVSGELGTQELPLPEPSHLSGFAALRSWLEEQNISSEEIIGIGHRVVHGGEHFPKSVLVDDDALKWIGFYSSLAPLHNPAHLLGIEKSIEAWPTIPQVAVFDTAFHQTVAPRAYRYAIPEELYKEHAIRRYGFHGTSHRFVSERAAEILKHPKEELALITAHLGNGCSAAAILGGKSIDTTMGFTPLEGLVMGTRSGNIDPSIFAYLERKWGWSAEQTLDLLNKKSGLLGLSGISQDMRHLIAARESGDERAALAIEIFVYQLAKAIGALTISLGGLDGLVFTGGIGENAAPVRAEVMALLAPLGVRLDSAANDRAVGGQGGIISPPNGKAPTVLVIPTDEELMIAQDTLTLVRQK